MEGAKILERRVRVDSSRGRAEKWPRGKQTGRKAEIVLGMVEQNRSHDSVDRHTKWPHPDSDAQAGIELENASRNQTNERS